MIQPNFSSPTSDQLNTDFMHMTSIPSLKIRIMALKYYDTFSNNFVNGFISTLTYTFEIMFEMPLSFHFQENVLQRKMHLLAQ